MVNGHFKHKMQKKVNARYAGKTFRKSAKYLKIELRLKGMDHKLVENIKQWRMNNHFDYVLSDRRLSIKI